MLVVEQAVDATRSFFVQLKKYQLDMVVDCEGG
jgi:hypothetical protein